MWCGGFQFLDLPSSGKASVGNIPNAQKVELNGTDHGVRDKPTLIFETPSLCSQGPFFEHPHEASWNAPHLWLKSVAKVELRRSSMPSEKVPAGASYHRLHCHGRILQLTTRHTPSWARCGAEIVSKGPKHPKEFKTSWSNQIISNLTYK